MLNVVVSSVLLIIGIAVVIYASTFPDFSLLTRVGPDLFPSIMGWVIIIFSAIVLFQALRKLASKRDSDGKIDLGEEKEKFRAALAKIKERKNNFIAMVGIPVMMLLYGCSLRRSALRYFPCCSCSYPSCSVGRGGRSVSS